jgi:hypothetical protein
LAATFTKGRRAVEAPRGHPVPRHSRAMPASPDDDFGAFLGREDMLFGLRDPFGLVRSELTESLREQVPDTELFSIQTQGEPKFLTLGRKEDGRFVVTHFAFAVRARLTVLFDERRRGEVLEALLTFLFGDVDSEHKRFRRFIDLHEEAARCFEDAVFKERFLAFRASAK